MTLFLYMDMDNVLVPLTNWNLVLTTIMLISSVRASTDTSNFGKDAMQMSDNAVYAQARHHLLYTVTIMINFVCFAVYWFMLRSEQQEIHSKHESLGWGRSLHLELVHSVPAIACFMNAICTNTILRKGNWVVISAIVFIYVLVIWIWHLVTGEQQYSFIDFTSVSAIYNFFIINLGSVVMYLLFCLIDERIKPVNDAMSIYSFLVSEKSHDV